MRISDWSSDVCSSDLELADLAGLGDQPAVVAHPVGEEVRQVAVTPDSVVIGHGVTDRLRPGGVTVHPLGHIGDAVLVLHVERGDPTPVLDRDPLRAGGVEKAPRSTGGTNTKTARDGGGGE